MPGSRDARSSSSVPPAEPRSSCLGGSAAIARAQIPGPHSLRCPSRSTRRRCSFLLPCRGPARSTSEGGKNIDYYEIAVRQFQQQILPVELPATTVWGYGPRVAQGGPIIFNAPIAHDRGKHRTPVRVKWVNELREDPADPMSPYLSHLLPVDPTLHWANPPGGTGGRDMPALLRRRHPAPTPAPSPS